MRVAFLLAVTLAGALRATPTAATGWTATQGKAATDPRVSRAGRPSLRVESDGAEARVLSAPVALTIGKQYELSGWVRTEGIAVSDRGRVPIATGAMLQMASMPFDVHSTSLGGTRDWERLSLRFTATRAQDRILLSVGRGGSFQGKAWFSEVSVDDAASVSPWPIPQAVKKLGPAYRYPHGGWIYLHLEGEPYERGYQHGQLMAREIEGYMDRCAASLDARAKESAWRSGRVTADALFLRGFDQELLAEMKGIADGAAAAGAKIFGRNVDLLDIVTANTTVELGTLRAALPKTPSGLEGLGFEPPPYASRKNEPAVTERCSAFAATGPATADGKMVIGHITMWSLVLAEQSNVMLDIQPVKGRRVLIQSYPGGIHSGLDWYQNDAGMVLAETTIEQGPFRREGKPVAFRARHAIQYAANMDELVRLLSDDNNGLYTNEWILADGETQEIAMLELGTRTRRLWRSSRNEWFGGTEGFYWGCNNVKDREVSMEYLPDPKGSYGSRPLFVPGPRDTKWQELYQQHKGKIDESFGFLAFHTSPLAGGGSMDAKVTTSEMASRSMVWGAIGRPDQSAWVPQSYWRENYAAITGMYPSGYRLIQARETAPSSEEKAGAPAKAAPKPAKIDAERLWKGWILPASAADLWLKGGADTYRRVLLDQEPEKELEGGRAAYRLEARDGDTPLSRLEFSTRSNHFWRLAYIKGTLLLHALRQEMGDERFFTLMRDFFNRHTTKTVNSAMFIEAAGPERREFFARWLDQPGLPGDSGGAVFQLTDLSRRLPTALIVYGTGPGAGANRYAAEELRRKFLESYDPVEVPLRKDFEVSEAELKDHDVIFIGRPESNGALARVAPRIGLRYEGEAFELNGTTYASERHALLLAAANPLNAQRMVIVMAGNSALETVRAAAPPERRYEFMVLEAGKPSVTGYVTPK